MTQFLAEDDAIARRRRDHTNAEPFVELTALQLPPAAACHGPGAAAGRPSECWAMAARDTGKASVARLHCPQLEDAGYVVGVYTAVEVAVTSWRLVSSLGVARLDVDIVMVQSPLGPPCGRYSRRDMPPSRLGQQLAEDGHNGR